MVHPESLEDPGDPEHQVHPEGLVGCLNQPVQNRNHRRVIARLGYQETPDTTDRKVLENDS